MKNKRNERNKRLAKLAFRGRSSGRCWDPARKIKIYHCYDDPKPLSYWDDVSFIWGSKYVSVNFLHPRYLYEDHIDTQAYEYAHALHATPNTDLFTDSTPNYVKRGKSRKAVLTWTLAQTTSDEFYAAWRDKGRELEHTSDYRQGTYFTVVQDDWALRVTICAPVEVRNEDELVNLVTIVRAVLDQKMSFADTYGSYTYGADEFAAERPVQPG